MLQDTIGNVYGTKKATGEYSNDIIYRFDLCDDGDFKNVLQIPDNQYDITYITDRPHPIGYDSKVIMEYGKAVISPNGDVYCWKRTPDTYSILKWVWVESPDSPHSNNVTVSKTGLSITWEPPNQDADKVTEYEVARSVDICGEFKAINKTKKPVLRYFDEDVNDGETYYYKVRAIKSSGYSGYSNKAVGTL